MTTTPEATRRKLARLAVCLTPDEVALIRDAAAVSGQSLIDFVTAAAVVRAEDTLADRRGAVSEADPDADGTSVPRESWLVHSA